MRVYSRRYLGYACAVFSVLLALGLTLWLTPQVIGLTPLFFAAVVLSAWFGGLGPGLLATALAGAASAYYFADPPGSLLIGFDDVIREAVFIGVALLISYLQGSTKRSQAQLQQAIADADAANRAKDRFLAVLSHELRNPLNPVLTLASAHEQDPSLPQPLREDFTMIRRNVELEARLIDDLLDLSRITSGKLAMKFDVVDLHEILRDAARICHEDIAAKQQRLIFDLTARRTLVEGDAARLRQVFWNILKNAVKFTPPQGTITLRTCELADGELQVIVRDTGIGIEPSRLGRIFAPFEQGDSAITREFGGLGLGLSISKMLIEAHGGSIQALSEGRGHGASVIVTIRPCPAPAAREPVPADSVQKPASPDQPRVRILLVEDHDDIRSVMSRLLRAQHDVATAAGVRDALEAAKRDEFDLVIVDLGLPDGSGLSLMRQLKQMYPVKGIAFTGFGTPEDQAQTRAAGFDDHLTKPVDMPTLEAAIQRVVCVSEAAH